MPGDKQQKMIGGYMAIVMLYFGWISPAGVLLYWDVSSIFGRGTAADHHVCDEARARRARSRLPPQRRPLRRRRRSRAMPAPDEVAEKKPANKGSKKSKKS